MAPQRVVRLVCDHGDINTVEFTLDLAGVDRAAAQDAGAAGPSMGLGYAVDNGQAALGQAGANLPPQFLVLGRVSHRDRVTLALRFLVAGALDLVKDDQGGRRRTESFF